MRWTRSSAPTTSAPAASASRALSPWANATTRCERPVPAGRTAEPRTIWSAWRGSSPVRMCSSIVSSNLAYAVSLTNLAPSSGAYCFSGSIFSTAARYFLPCLAISSSSSALNLNAHAPRGAFDHAHRGLDVVGIQVFHFRFGDFAHLGPPYRARSGAARSTAALVDARSLLDQVSGGRCLGDEAERAILKDRDQRGDDHARLGGRALVVFLQERHHVDAVLAQRRADGRRGGGFASGQLQGDDGLNLFCHLDLRQFAGPVRSPVRPVSPVQRMTQGHGLCLFRG